MSDLHAIFRSTGDRWEAYSRPVSIHAAGRTLDEARDEFYRAAEFHFGESLSEVDIRNHVEHPILSDVYVRVAVDRHTLEREHTAGVLRGTLALPDQVEQLRAAAIEASTGDIVFVACMPGDLLDWVIAQLGRTDALQVCTAVAGDMLWWSSMAAPDADFRGTLTESETLGEAGLASSSTTIADMIRSDRHRHGSSDRGDLAHGGRTLLVTR